MATNTLLNSILIIGQLGFPELGLRGAAIATAIARVVELTVLATVVYRKRTPVAANFRQLFLRFDRDFLKRYFRTSLPVLLNETLWSTGVSLYTVAYGLLGTGALASVQIASTVFQLFLVLIRGLSDACAILIGHKIGSGDEAAASRDGQRFMALVPMIGVVMCILLILLRPVILTFFTVTPETLQMNMEMLALQAFMLIP